MRHLLLLTSLLAAILALPLVRRDIVDPPITSPTANTVWHVGQTETVTWFVVLLLSCTGVHPNTPQEYYWLAGEPDQPGRDVGSRLLVQQQREPHVK